VKEMAGIDRNLSSIILTVLAMLAGACDLRAQRRFGLPAPMDRPGAVSRQPHAAEEPAVSVTSLTAPKNAKKAFERAWKEFFGQRPNYGNAIEELEQAVKIHPPYIDAWILLGKTRLVLDQEVRAKEAFERALAADPKAIAAYLPLALIELKNGRDAEAARLVDQVLQIDPHFAEAHLYRAVAYYNLGKIDIAKRSLQIVLRSGEDHLFLRAQFISGSMLSDRIRSQLAQWEALDQVK
jgi:tetratricopeptide (TPR) repeat protein